MIIKIITTDKKLTKSIIGQMPTASLIHLLDGQILGHVVGCRPKLGNKLMLIKCAGEYYLHDMSWTRGESQYKPMYKKLGKWSSVHRFDSDSESDKYWGAYLDAKRIAEKTHIYI